MSYLTRSQLPVVIAVLLLVLVTLSSFLFGIPRVYSQSSSVPITGWAWSDNTGWISLNCTNTNSCATANYGLALQNSSNLITGYAWSDNVGWIKFGSLSSYPSGSGTTAADATLQSNGTITGWARACAGTLNGDCSSMSDAAGGWNGWISLSGTGYGVTTVGNSNYTGNWAWDSDASGWIAFNAVFPSCTPSGPVCMLSTTNVGQQMSSSTTQYCQSVTVDPCAYGCSAGSCLPGTGDPGWLSASASSIVAQKKISSGSTVTLYYYVPNAKNCTLTGTNGDKWATSLNTLAVNAQHVAVGNKTTSAIQSRVVYTLACQKNSGSPTTWTSPSNTVTITTAPQFQEI